MIRFHAFVRKSLSKKLYVDTITPSKCCTDICSLLHVTRYNVSYTPNVLRETHRIDLGSDAFTFFSYINTKYSNF